MFEVARATLFFFLIVVSAGMAQGQSLPKVRAAYTSIGIQFDPVYIMKELDLPRKYGLDAEVLFIPVSSRAIQAAYSGRGSIYHERRRGQYQREYERRRLCRLDRHAQHLRIQDHREPGDQKA